MTRVGLAPTTSAASTYSDRRRVSTEPRATLAYTIHPLIDSTMTSRETLGPMAYRMTSASRMPGNASRVSMTRMMTVSVSPPT